MSYCMGALAASKPVCALQHDRLSLVGGRASKLKVLRIDSSRRSYLSGSRVLPRSRRNAPVRAADSSQLQLVFASDEDVEGAPQDPMQREIPPLQTASMPRPPPPRYDSYAPPPRPAPAVYGYPGLSTPSGYTVPTPRESLSTTSMGTRRVGAAYEAAARVEALIQRQRQRHASRVGGQTTTSTFSSAISSAASTLTSAPIPPPPPTETSPPEPRRKNLDAELERLQKVIAESKGDEALRATAEYLATEQIQQSADADARQQHLQMQLEEANFQLTQMLMDQRAWQQSYLVAEAEAAAAQRGQAAAAEAAKQMKVAKHLGTTATALREQQDAVRKEMFALKAALPGALEAMVGELTAAVESQSLGPLKEMTELYTSEVGLRKKLHNELVDLRGNIRVYCRVRPLLAAESSNPESSTRFPAGNERIAIRQGGREEKTYSYERVFQPAEDQVAVFSEIQPLITSVMDGYNVTIFAYGQTGSGKTHTMEGTTSNPGVNLRALSDLFSVATARADQYDTVIRASMLEIYNESIFDLLVPNPQNKGLEVKHASGEGVQVSGLSSREVLSSEDVLSLVSEATKHRSTFSTNMNEHSSRSHCMLSVQVTSANKVTEQVTRSKLHLVDLAGSERLSRSEAEGDRLKEAQAINKSLSALGDVIAALSQKKGHVPFRNSKLTQVLQDSMEGTAKVAMFVNVSPTQESAGESVCSLNFASRVRGVELGPAGSANKTPAKGAPNSAAKRPQSARP
uniref:Kinesin-like protein n=1 Tax=Pyramimonas obovata TaxID=1411642 RepID=A0A7S0N872_9CHLO|mmetsp:Transcript_20501/g.44832  ORF Transcript_20501/g.44832 Transcript_20501/m.44832 type:complete len:743 (+) Transcript_20501:122-2350(+)